MADLSKVPTPRCDGIHPSPEVTAAYAKIIANVSKLDDKTDLNKWIKAMAAQLQDLVRRAASPKCAERRQAKLIYYWKLYEERQHAKTD